MIKKKNKKIERVVLVYSHKAFFSEKKSLDIVKDFLKSEKIIFDTVLIDNFGRDNLNSVDLVLVLGGDGTFIRVSHFLGDEFILGINSDCETSEGGLMNLNMKKIKKLKRIFDGDYSIMKRRRLEVFLNDEIIPARVLNEVYFGAENQFHTSRYDLILGLRREEQRSSGVLVSTFTGSGAWYKSAGGRKFFGKDTVKYIVREPFVSRVFKSKLRKGEVILDIEFVSKMHHNAVVSIDSNLVYPVKFSDRVRVKKSNLDLNCVK